MKKLLLSVLFVFPVLSQACDTKLDLIKYYTSIYDSVEAQHNSQLKNVASKEITENMMRLISCSSKPLNSYDLFVSSQKNEAEPMITIVTLNETY